MREAAPCESGPGQGVQGGGGSLGAQLPKAQDSAGRPARREQEWGCLIR